jgi:hypothetical protein
MPWRSLSVSGAVIPTAAPIFCRITKMGCVLIILGEDVQTNVIQGVQNSSRMTRVRGEFLVYLSLLQSHFGVSIPKWASGDLQIQFADFLFYLASTIT